MALMAPDLHNLVSALRPGLVEGGLLLRKTDLSNRNAIKRLTRVKMVQCCEQRGPVMQRSDIHTVHSLTLECHQHLYTRRRIRNRNIVNVYKWNIVLISY